MLLSKASAFFKAVRLLVLRIGHGHALFNCNALSYSLLMTLVPLAAALSLLAAKVYELNSDALHIFLSQKETNTLLVRFLPYSTQEINHLFLRILKYATTLGWIGALFLFFSVFSLYGTLQEVFNATWNAGRGRPLYKSIGTAGLITLLFSVMFTLSVKISRLPLLDYHITLFLLGKLLSFLSLVTAFAFLYKLIPRMQVHWKSAFIGALFAGSLYEICRMGLNFYVTSLFAYHEIWGALSLIPVFIFTVYLLSFIISSGNDMAYVTQHFQKLEKDGAFRESFFRR